MRVVLKITLAIISRLLFLVHSLLTIGYVVELKESYVYWFLCITNILLLVESFYSVVKKRGEENRWICLSALFYLLSTVPAIWFLELYKLEQINRNVPDLDTSNVTNASTAENVTTAGIADNGNTFKISQFMPFDTDTNRLIEVIEQTLLLMMIITRWLMPRGAITRDELSQVLFVYIAVASDIMELFQLFEERPVLDTPNMNVIILAVWSVSLLQFTLVLTASQSLRRARVMGVVGDPSKEVDDGTQSQSQTNKRHPCIKFFRTPEVWSLIVSLFLMDGPFLCVRMYCLLRLNLFTYNIIFFVVKNFLMVLLLLYRLVIVSFQICVPGFDEKWFGEDNLAADYSDKNEVKAGSREESGRDAVQLRSRNQEAPSYGVDSPQRQQRSMKRQYFSDGPEQMYRIHGRLRDSSERRMHGRGGFSNL